MELIAGDIGGTKSWLAWMTGEADDAMRPRFEKRYASADFASAEALLRQFIADAQTTARPDRLVLALPGPQHADRKSTRLNSSHQKISYAVFCLKKKKGQ